MAKEIDGATARTWHEAGTATFLDVRPRRMYQAGHIPGALSNPASEFDMGVISSIPKDATIVVYCVRGIASAQVADYLASIGYTNVFSLAGGYKAWLA